LLVDRLNICHYLWIMKFKIFLWTVSTYQRNPRLFMIDPLTAGPRIVKIQIKTILTMEPNVIIYACYTDQYSRTIPYMPLRCCGGIFYYTLFWQSYVGNCSDSPSLKILLNRIKWPHFKMLCNINCHLLLFSCRSYRYGY